MPPPAEGGQVQRFSQILYTYEPQVLSVIDIQPENLEAVKAGKISPSRHRSYVRLYDLAKANQSWGKS